MKFTKIPKNSDIECAVCHEPAELVLKFTRRDVGDIHFFVCQKCFERLKNDFKNNNLTEIKI